MKFRQAFKSSFQLFCRTGLFENQFGIHLVHFNSNLYAGVEEYKRRIERFVDIVNRPNKIYFVFIHEDYLYIDAYRNEEFNNALFNDMLDLEKYIKEKYIHIDYTILYLDFKHHPIPPNSKIFNIVLQSNTFFNREEDAPLNDFRKFCGQVLVDLFNTKLVNDALNENIFIN